MVNIKDEKIGVARLKPTRYDNSKGPRIGPSLFYSLELLNKYIKLRVTSFFKINLILNNLFS